MWHLHIYIPSNSIISHLQFDINESEEYSSEMLVSMKQCCWQFKLLDYFIAVITLYLYQVAALTIKCDLKHVLINFLV